MKTLPLVVAVLSVIATGTQTSRAATAEVPVLFGNLQQTAMGTELDPRGNRTDTYFTGVIAYYPPCCDWGLNFFNSYFVFDLTDINFETATSAVLQLKAGSWGHFSGPTETVGLFDVSTDTAFLRNPRSDPAAFSDLATGLSYGESVLADPRNPDASVQLELNANGLEAINSAVGAGEFKVGATLLSILEGSGVLEGDNVFGGTGVPSDIRLTLEDAQGNRLVLTSSVPEPSTWVLVSVAGILGSVFRVRTKTSSARLLSGRSYPKSAL